MFKIRKLQWNDFQDLADNYYSYYDEVKENPDFGITFFNVRPSLQYEAEWFKNLYKDILDGTAIGVVAEVDGKAVGLCEVRAMRPGTEASHIGILGIAIRKEYRGKGIGKALMIEAINECHGKFELITLSVFESNTVARRLYENLGSKFLGIFNILLKGITTIMVRCLCT